MSSSEGLDIVDAVLDRVDPVGMNRSLQEALLGAARRPAKVAKATARLTGGMAEVAAGTGLRMIGRQPGGPVTPDARDRRFNDPAWSENPVFRAMLESYLLHGRWIEELVESAGLTEPAASKARFFAKLLVDAVAPTNFLPTNPAAIRKAFETGGLSVVRGMRNFAGDVVHRRGWPRQVDASPFTLGENMAATKGKVVFRNDLIELIQYAPQTEKVHEIPLLFSPPWINKYYIMDLAPGKSLAEWAVSHGLTVFMISYRNPDASMREFGFDDYLLHGPRAAIDVVRDITGADKINTLALCLGGTLNTAMLAYLDACGEDLVHSSTYLNSLTDFTDAGVLGSVFADRQAVGAVGKRMAAKGYLDAKDMARTFDLLRANDLVFNYVSSSWLMGEAPPPFDLLAWNADSTRMPAKMHSFYLQKCYVENALAQDRMELAGKRLKVSEIDQETYIVAAVEDHIVPWRGSYRTTQIFQGPVRFVLTSSGHIAGVVNPPNPKSRLWTNDDIAADPDEWLAGAVEHRDTWWNDWIPWITARSGELRRPPAMGGKKHRPLCDAPGTYVRA